VIPEEENNTVREGFLDVKAVVRARRRFRSTGGNKYQDEKLSKPIG